MMYSGLQMVRPCRSDRAGAEEVVSVLAAAGGGCRQALIFFAYATSWVLLVGR
jgi:hypothetical protein